MPGRWETGRAGKSRRGTSSVLDGEPNAGRGGWDCIGHGKTLFVPDWMASDAASALLLCREQGLITARMSRMDPEMAWVIYRLTLHRPGSAN
ncbi:MAG: hypothetical protein ABSA78_01535 [Candidatus Sulfotelmatobacter sp.]